MSWFNSPERIRALRIEAQSWIGTPFFCNGNTKQMGVSCQKLASEIYRAVGACSIDVPEVAMAHARFSKESILESFMDGRTEFFKCWPHEEGDLLGFRIYHVIHHCGIYLGNGDFIHAMEGLGTVVSSLHDATWNMRLAGMWRLKDGGLITGTGEPPKIERESVMPREAVERVGVSILDRHIR